MRRPLLGLAIVLGTSVLATTDRAHAQLTPGTGVGTDVFSFYYGYYLPHAAAIAAQQTPMDTLNAITASRQFNAVTDRARLYDPISPYGAEETDPTQPWARGEERTPGGAGPELRDQPGRVALARGGGPALYYNRTGPYYPTMRVGRGPNRNLAVMRGGGGAAWAWAAWAWACPACAELTGPSRSTRPIDRDPERPSGFHFGADVLRGGCEGPSHGELQRRWVRINSG